MNNIKDYSSFLNEAEGIRQYLKPKSKEEIEKIINKYREGGTVHIFKEVIGKVLLNIKPLNDQIQFEFKDGSKYLMQHYQDCCERVTIEDINGDLNDLIGEPLLVAEEVVADNPNASESGTLTFYKFATVNGYVDIRWLDTSNGYYSESVDFEKVESFN